MSNRKPNIVLIAIDSLHVCLLDGTEIAQPLFSQTNTTGAL